ncbi:MAG: response regulator [Acidobacteria bacterium]|nr:response regulator [Acidobacteriota bacterium]
MMPRHILLIDDEEDIREVVALSLESVAGWRVTSAGSGSEGIELARRSRPDAILLDVMMPEQDGPATLRLLRGNGETSGIPVIFLTAKVQAIERERLKEAGAVGFLSKPFNPVTLASEVSAILGWPSQ